MLAFLSCALSLHDRPAENEIPAAGDDLAGGAVGINAADAVEEPRAFIASHEDSHQFVSHARQLRTVVHSIF
jgi:hypothetical protein